MRKLASQLYVGLATFDVTTWHTCSASCNTSAHSLKSTARFRAVQILTIKTEFDPAVNSIRIQSIKIGFDSNSVLVSVQTILKKRPEGKTIAKHDLLLSL